VKFHVNRKGTVRLNKSRWLHSKNDESVIIALCSIKYWEATVLREPKKKETLEVNFFFEHSYASSWKSKCLNILKLTIEKKRQSSVVGKCYDAILLLSFLAWRTLFSYANVTAEGKLLTTAHLETIAKAVYGSIELPIYYCLRITLIFQNVKR